MKIGTPFVALILTLLLIAACDTDDQKDPCLSIDPLFEFFIIELVDSEGNNLIENATYKASDIKIIFNGNIIGGVPQTATPANFISLQLFAEANNKNIDIVLTNDEIDKLILKIDKGTENSCGFIPLNVTSAFYNEMEQNLTFQDTVDRIQKIIVVK